MTELRLRPVYPERGPDRRGPDRGPERGLQRRPELKQLVAEASRALATLDADRLEELALSCQALNRDLKPATVAERASLARQAREAVGDLAVFGRVLEVTRANLKVMRRLRQLHDIGFGEGRFGYGGDAEWSGNPTVNAAENISGNVHGHD